MADHLERTSRYFDGELPESEHAEVIAHLATCEACQQLLGAAVSLDAAVSTHRARRWWLVAVPLAAAAAAVAIWFAVRTSPQAPQLALAAERAVEPRFSGELFAPYRPRAVMRGAQARENISLATLAELEQRGDQQDLVAALAASGDLARADALAKSETDRAAVALLAGDPERALAHAYADPTPAGTWNLALAARDLGLDHLSAAAFARVDDAGWKVEARTLAPHLVDFAAIEKAGANMLAGGPLIDAAASPTFARIELYDALRLAGSRADVERLRPLAVQLDAVPALERVAASDFSVRAPFFADYRQLIAWTLPPDRTVAMLDKLKAIGAPVADIYVGAAILGSQVGPRADELRAIVAPWHDPWFELFIERERIQTAYPGTDLRAEPALVHALEGCGDPRWAMRCSMLEKDLGSLLGTTGRDDEAETHALVAVADAKLAGIPSLVGQARLLLAEIHRRHGRFALARAELEEAALVYDEPQLKRFSEIGRASIAFAARDLDAARALLPTPNADVLGLSIAVDLARMSGLAKDADVAKAWIAAATDELLAATARARLDDRQITALHTRAKPAATTASGRAARTWAYATLIGSAASHEAWAAVIALAGEEQPFADAPCVLVASTDDDRLAIAARTPKGLFGATGKLVDKQPIVPADIVTELAACPGIAVVARAPLHGRDDLLPAKDAWWFAGDARSLPPTSPARAVQIFDARPPDTSLPKLPPLAPSHETFDASLAGTDATPSRVLALIGGAGYAELHAHGIVAASDKDAAYLALSPEPSGVYALRADAIRGAVLPSAPIVVLAACRAAHVAPLQRERWSLPDALLAAGARAVVAATVEIADADARAVFDDLHHRLAAGEPIAQALAAVRVAHGDWAGHLLLFE